MSSSTNNNAGAISIEMVATKNGTTTANRVQQNGVANKTGQSNGKQQEQEAAPTAICANANGMTKPTTTTNAVAMAANQKSAAKPNGTGNGAVMVVDAAMAAASPKRCAPKMDTQERLFGPKTAAPETPKKKITDTYRSSISFVDNSTAPSSPARTPKKAVPILERNPITGEVKMPKKIAM